MSNVVVVLIICCIMVLRGTGSLFPVFEYPNLAGTHTCWNLIRFGTRVKNGLVIAVMLKG